MIITLKKHIFFFLHGLDFDYIKLPACTIMLRSLFAWLFSLGFKIRIVKNMSNLTLDYTYVKSFLLSSSFPNLIIFLPIYSVIPATHLDVIVNSSPWPKASHELCHILVIPVSEIYSQYVFFCPSSATTTSTLGPSSCICASALDLIFCSASTKVYKSFTLQWSHKMWTGACDLTR